MLYRYRAPGKGDCSGTGNLDNLVFGENLTEGINLAFLTGQLDDDIFRAYIDNLRSEDVYYIYDISAIVLSGVYLDKHQLTADGINLAEVDDFYYINQLAQLGHDLIQLMITVYGYDDVYSGNISFFGIAGGYAFNVEGTAADKAGDMSQYARLIVYKDSEKIFFHLSLPPSIMLSSGSPGATIGSTSSSSGIITSTSAGPS